MVERLVGEHAEVATMISGLRSAVANRRVELHHVRDLLAHLADHLDRHLDYEEEQIGPVLARLS